MLFCPQHKGRDCFQAKEIKLQEKRTPREVQSSTLIKTLTVFIYHIPEINLTHSVPVLSSYRNKSIDLLCKSVDCFLYEGNTGI